MAGITAEMTIEGGEELVRKLIQMGLDVEQALETAALLGAELFVQAANGLAPAPLIEAQVAERGKAAVSIDVGFPKEKWYWLFKETGATAHEISGAPLVFEGDEGTVATWEVDHPGVAAEPFLRPAFDGEQDRVEEKIGDEIRKVVER